MGCASCRRSGCAGSACRDRLVIMTTCKACPHNGSIGGFHLVASIGDAAPPLSMVAAGRNPRTFGHPGAGGSIGWADPDTRLAVAMTHNRMFRATTPEENPFVPIGEAVRKALGVSG